MRAKMIRDAVSGELEAQPPEYVPRGPVRVPRPLPPDRCKQPPTALPQYTVATPENERIKGHLYDAVSWRYLGLASDEDKGKNPNRVPFSSNIGGGKQKVVIW